MLLRIVARIVLVGLGIVGRAPTPTPTPAPPVRPRLVIPDYHRLADWPTWRALGRCEEGTSSGVDGISWGHDGPAFVGGFGMARSTYDWGARLAGLPGWRVGTPPLVQVLVARSVREHGGHWGCQTW